MKIKSIKLKDFKRFTDLTIEGLPETAKLVVIIGPNGCGKSSVFDALKLKDCLPNAVGPEMMPDDYYQLLEYYFKSDEKRHRYSCYGSLSQTPNDRRLSYHRATSIVQLHDGLVNFSYRGALPIQQLYDGLIIEFHRKELRDNKEWEKSVHVRSAYRNYSVTQPPVVSRHDPLQEGSLVRLMENDETFALNCRYLVSRWLERSSKIGESDQNLTDLQNEIFGELRDAMRRLFTDPPLALKSLGHPTDGDLFEFDKGTSERFTYQNLASGEKAALDLLLDVIVTKAENDETIICIDEPEAHIHTKLQGKLLEELYNLVSEKSQLWIATHSVGMVRKAYEIWRADPDSVVFLDFGKDDSGQDRDFDGPVKIEPAKPNPNFWASTYEVVLGDLAGLVVTGRTVFCEGEEFDEECYRNIFKGTYPEVCFVSLGARGNVEKSVTAANLAIEKIVKSARVIGIVDRDKATEGEIERNAKKGIRTLSRTTIESYLLDDEVLAKLCEDHDASDKIQDLLTAKQDALDKHGLKASDNLKPIVQQVHGAAQKILKSANLGNTRESFMMDVLASRIQPGMKVYEQLEKDIFGE